MFLTMVGRILKSFLSLIIVSVFVVNLYSAEVEFSGTFYDQNAFVKNPVSGSSFCISEILLNGKKVKAELNTGVVVVDFAANGLNFCDKFDMVVKYSGDSKPELINPKSFVATSTFELVSAKIESAGNSFNLVVTIKGENAPLPFYIEHYRAGQWVVAGVFAGQGKSEEKVYTVPFAGLPGENRIRVYQVDSDGMKEREVETTVISPKTESAKFKYVAKDKEIKFTEVTEYKVVDASTGNTMLHGMSDRVDASSLVKGKYFIVYEDVYKKFSVK